jgi:hypothetical protein
VITRLARTHPDLVRARVLAGWLFEPDRLRHPTPTDPTALRQALHDLQRIHIPTARAALLALEQRLPDLAREQRLPDLAREQRLPDLALKQRLPDTRRPTADLAPLVDLACDLLRDVLVRYATLPPRPQHLTPSREHPRSLAHREHLDILPAAWDIASPTLLDLSPGTALALPIDLSLETADPASLPPDALATLLGELDDHLFALGLAPLRRVYLHAAARLALPTADIFLLTPDELQAALRGASFSLTERRRDHAHHATLFPPLQLLDGLPVPGRSDSHLQGASPSAPSSRAPSPRAGTSPTSSPTPLLPPTSSRSPPSPPRPPWSCAPSACAPSAASTAAP